MKLHNTINGEELKEKIKNSTEKRTTISFYKYAKIGNPQLFRDHLYYHWMQLGVLGRIYVANEGINAQLSLPSDNLEAFRQTLLLSEEGIAIFLDRPIAIAFFVFGLLVLLFRVKQKSS